MQLSNVSCHLLHQCAILWWLSCFFFGLELQNVDHATELMFSYLLLGQVTKEGNTFVQHRSLYVILYAIFQQSRCKLAMTWGNQKHFQTLWVSRKFRMLFPISRILTSLHFLQQFKFSGLPQSCLSTGAKQQIKYLPFRGPKSSTIIDRLTSPRLLAETFSHSSCHALLCN